MDKYLLDMTGIQKTFKDGDKELIVLDQLDFRMHENDFVAIVGKSGSGKTTLLNIISLLDRRFEGRYFFNGVDTGRLNDRDRFDLRVHNIAYMFQNHNLIFELSVIQNVEMPLGYRGVDYKTRRMIAAQCLDKVGLAGKANQKIHQLSGGEQQRVSLARALSTSPKLLIADEPTGNLDGETTAVIMDLLFSINKYTSIVLVTHDQDLAQNCSRVYQLDKAVLKRQKGYSIKQ